jgi:hypothetical protein
MIHAFYHVACMHHWREIMSEHFRVIANANQNKTPEVFLRIGFTGDKHDAGFIYHLGTSLGLRFEILFSGSGNHNFEYPTLERLHMESRLDGDPILYFHTKGASRPGDWHSTMWRWYMNTMLLKQLPAAIGMLNSGHGWAAPILSGGIGPGEHSPGNFWIATREHLRKLPDLPSFRPKWKAALPGNWISDRHGAEAWIGYAEGNPCVLANNAHRIWEPSWWVNNPDMQQLVSRT